MTIAQMAIVLCIFTRMVKKSMRKIKYYAIWYTSHYKFVFLSSYHCRVYNNVHLLVVICIRTETSVSQKLIQHFEHWYCDPEKNRSQLFHIFTLIWEQKTESNE